MYNENKISRPRFKILIEAYECSPRQEHAAGASWQIVSRLAEWFDVWVLTEETQYSAEIMDYLEKHPDLANTLHFQFISRRKKGGFKRKRPPLPIRETFDYIRWQKDAFQAAQQLHRKVRFDIVHHLRSNSFRRPGYLWKLDIPFIWGPMGGTCSVNPRLLSGLDQVSKIQYRIRNLINTIQFRFDRHVQNAIANSTCIFTQTSNDQRKLKGVHGRDSELLHEQAAAKINGKTHSYDNRRKLNVAWVGRCIAGKALHFLLDAVAHLAEKELITLHIVGDGPALNRWKKRAENLKIHDCCIWYGWVDAKRAGEILKNCDMLAFTSILEGTPATITNSLSLGVPVISLKHYGMADLIDDQCGFPISVENPKCITQQISDTLNSILRRPELIEQKSRHSLETAETCGWEQSAETIRQAYWNALGIFDVCQETKFMTPEAIKSFEVVC